MMHQKAGLPHKADDRLKQNILRMRDKWGDRGYGWLWIIREVLCALDTPAIKWKDKDSLLINTDGLQKEFYEFLDDCINRYKVLRANEQWIWCPIIYEDLRKRQRCNYKGRLITMRKKGDKGKEQALREEWIEKTKIDEELI